MKAKHHPTIRKTNKYQRPFLYFFIGITLGVLLLLTSVLVHYESKYKNRVYPYLTIADISFTGFTREEIIDYWANRNDQLRNVQFSFEFESTVATLSAEDLKVGFDATASANQALAVGRSSDHVKNIQEKIYSLTKTTALKPQFVWDPEALNSLLDTLSQSIDIEPENALFEFQNGRVSAFKLSKSGRALDKSALLRQVENQIVLLSSESQPQATINFPLPIIAKEPLIQTDQANDLGIQELIGKGESTFKGSIPGRIHNVALAASRINGHLVPPGQTFSFNQALGDISAATGYKQAYVIKQGRTVLDDGGGVCQVSTTLFRAALNSGLPITERHAHSYRVSYYEQGGWKPGFDATVYAPSYDLKLKNDTPAHILIQAQTDTKNLTLVFELYGTKDGRISEISPTRLWDPRPAPPDLIQDDPTLPTGQMKQVDWANPGIKAAFDYKVTKNGEVMFEKNFFSNFVPWQAVYLKGTGPAQ